MHFMSRDEREFLYIFRLERRFCPSILAIEKDRERFVLCPSFYSYYAQVKAIIAPTKPFPRRLHLPAATF